MEIRIREFEAMDKNSWADLRSHLWPDQTASEHLAEVTRLERLHRLPLVLVAEDESRQLVGFLELSIRTEANGCLSSPVPFLEGWYVLDSHRGQGIGRMLVEMAERWSIANGYTELASDSLIDNALSESAHLALGFAEVERTICWRKDLET